MAVDYLALARANGATSSTAQDGMTADQIASLYEQDLGRDPSGAEIANWLNGTYGPDPATQIPQSGEAQAYASSHSVSDLGRTARGPVSSTEPVASPQPMTGGSPSGSGGMTSTGNPQQDMQQLLQSGVDPQTAISLINSHYGLPNGNSYAWRSIPGAPGGGVVEVPGGQYFAPGPNGQWGINAGDSGGAAQYSQARASAGSTQSSLASAGSAGTKGYFSGTLPSSVTALGDPNTLLSLGVPPATLQKYGFTQNADGSWGGSLSVDAQGNAIAPNGQPITGADLQWLEQQANQRGYMGPPSVATSSDPTAGGSNANGNLTASSPSYTAFAPWDIPFVAPTAAQAAATPGEQFMVDQANQGIERSAAAKGTLLTGGTLKDLAGYDEGLASTAYSDVYNRALGEYQQAYNIYNGNQAGQFNRLASVAGLGQVAASTLGNQGMTMAGMGANSIMAGGQAAAAGIMGAGNATQAAFGNIGNSVTSLGMLPYMNSTSSY